MLILNFSEVQNLENDLKGYESKNKLEYNRMTKKKSNRQKLQKDINDTSEEELNESAFQGKCCPHVSRAVNFGRVKRILKTGNISVCSGCTNSVPEDEVWFCLQCGYRGCGRTSSEKHGLQHFKTIHSDCHSLVLSASSGMVWCYDCDEEVQLQSSRNLKQCVEFILKMKGNNNTAAESVKNEKKSLSNQQSLLETGETALKEQNSVKHTSDVLAKKSEKSKKDVVPPKTTVKGLKNLGNTCYFNAVMQSLSQTPLLYSVLEELCTVNYKWEVPKLKISNDSIVEDTETVSLSITLPREFQLVHTFFEFLKKMTSPTQNKAEVINPDDLFRDLQKKSPQFQYYLQQDSHELLRQFLDGIRQDEVKRNKKAILKHFNLINTSPEDIEDEVKKLIKAYGCYASHTLVDKIFGGLLISTVLCEECKMSSQVFEPFMDMSLPLFEEKQQESCDQPCAWLDGGKQVDAKPIRGRKLEQDVDEGSEEFLSARAQKDPTKPSKHQERKMKQMEKKEKKRQKKMSNKKTTSVDLNGNSLEDIADSTMVDEVEIDTETDPQNLNLEVDSREAEPEEISLSKEERTLSNGNIVSKEEKNSEKVLMDTDLGNPEIDKETGETITTHKDSVSTNTPDKDLVESAEAVVLTVNDGVLNSVSASSEENDSEIIPSEKSTDCPEENQGEDESLDQSIADLTDNLERTFTNGLDERMRALSMQVKEVRIRRDSDRQENILTSSSSDGESPQSNLESDESVEEATNNEKEENLSHNLSESQTKEWIMKSVTTLKPRKHVVPLECSIDSCLMHFTKPELLTGNNKFRCENCSEIKCKKTGDKKAAVYSNASKQLLVFSPPAILTLHLKRFQQVGMSLRKVNRFVEFPLVLDLTPYCSSACLVLPHMASVKDEILYSLYGIVEHSGHLRSGHYTAYVKVSKRTLSRSFVSQLPLAQCDLEQLLQKFYKRNSSEEAVATEEEEEGRRWFYISDSVVREVSESVVLKCQAYLLFYERIK